MNPTKLLIGFVPWALFGLLTHLQIQEIAGVAAALAAVTSLVILVVQSRGGVKIIDATSMVVFALLAVVGFGVPGGAAWITAYGRSSAAFALALVMLVSAVTVPFSQQYARESVPEAYWHTARFRAVNRTISALWGGLLLVMALSHTVAAVLLADGVGGGQVLLNWVLPVLLVVWGVKRTRALSGQTPAPEPVSAGRR